MERFLRCHTKEDYFEIETFQAVLRQVQMELDILTEGELRREQYWRYNCLYFDGIDIVDGRVTVTGPVTHSRPMLVVDWQRAQQYTDRPVKMALAGPSTLLGPSHLKDEYYGNRKALHFDLAQAINVEVRALANAGCTWIQLDEPRLGYEPRAAVEYGIEALDVCFAGVPVGIERIVHICRGYASVDGDQGGRNPADPYHLLADALENSCATIVSLEAAAEGFDLSLLDRFKETKIMLGFISNLSSEVETVDDIRARIEAALDHIEADRLIASSDCGFANFLDVESTPVWRKVWNLVQAAKSL
jgi:5-methyltetrahydropteroyltriglutamate--homocysteine methyltransferase|tara:strand:- start:147 stop:1055 length:909 start_codon:yes stop_codon:yes gene_type:complete